VSRFRFIDAEKAHFPMPILCKVVLARQAVLQQEPRGRYPYGVDRGGA
jgi:hypothetical protein